MGHEAIDPARHFPEALHAIYQVEGFVGQGAFSTVWRGVHKTSGQARAIKKIDTTDLSPREIAHEIAIMRFLRHENVVRCYDVFMECQFVSVVMDLFNGGDLVDGLNLHRRVHGRLRNFQLRHLVKQMTAAVAHVHSLHIIHRDVKGENFLSDRPQIGDPNTRVALSDFGTAIRVDPGEKVWTRVGTPAFWAPEIYAGAYDFKVDVWALGVTTYILLTGMLPGDGTNSEYICVADPKLDLLENGNGPWRLPFHTCFGCRHYLAGCLSKDSCGRISARRALECHWFLHPPEASPKPQAAIIDEDVGRSTLRMVAEGLKMNCCGVIQLCLDRFCDPKEVEAAAQRWSKASSKSSGKAHTLSNGLLEKEVLEKQATDLTKQISRNLLQHQDSIKH